MKRVLFALIIFAFASGCSQTKNPSVRASSEDKQGPTNLIKVLDRVTCHESYGRCDQEKIDEIWEACLRDGYVTSLPPQDVMSSRDLKELVFEQTTEMVNRPSTSESVDETGIVSTNDGEETVEVEKTVKGYCIGSEYVMK